MLVSIAILSQVHGNVPNSIPCISKNCYTAFEITTDFQTALEMCKKTQGHLMTVRSSESNHAILDLLTDIKGEFWIGLQFNDKGCTDTSLELRRYEWITGDTLTDFTNWRNNESFCTQKCVSVSRDLKWTEKPCHDKADGFLCEHPFVCEPLVPTEAGESLEYTTPFGVAGKGSISFPPGTLATANPSGIRHICAPDQGWLRAPWFCEVEGGGCQHKCVKNGGPQCVCPPGQALQSNGVTCASTSNDPCLTMGCEHTCIPPKGSCSCQDGYELREDGKGCRDIDECRFAVICQSSKCVNTMGSYECHCLDGFEKENGNCVDIDECFSSPCEHACENTRGSYTCSCFEGFRQRIDDHTQCEIHCDKSECPAQCDINDPTECRCPEGYIMDMPMQGIRVCVDMDECSGNYCSHGCTNTFGSYICSCPVGFALIDGYNCEEDYSEGSGFTTPSDTVTPTSNDTTDITSAMTAGGLLGIMVCIVLMILIIVFLVHQISKRRSSWKVACMHKNQGEDLQDLQQVTTEKYTKKSTFVNRDLKQDT